MLVNTKCLIKACDEIHLHYSFVGNNQNFVNVLKNGRINRFFNTITPFNSEIASKICLDKYLSYLMLKDFVKMPKTISYIDPAIDQKYKEYATFKSIEEIITDIGNNFQLPVIIKPNFGSFAKNVRLCKTLEEVEAALKNIYNKDSEKYDFLALAQEFIEIQEELRVISYAGEIMLCYKKNSFMRKNVKGEDVEWKNMKSEIIYNLDLLAKIKAFIEPIFVHSEIKFCGIDLAIDKDKNFVLIELNSKPWFESFVKNNGEEKLVEFYKHLLSKL